MNLCQCGCGQTTTNYGKRVSKYIKGHNLKGKRTKNYKGGRHFNGNYWYLWKPNYLRNQKTGYVLEHKFVFQEYHKCCMLPWGNIHHINGIKTDNRIENLQGMMESEHIRQHSILDKRMVGNTYNRINMSGRKCSKCDSSETYMDKSYNRPLWLTDGNGNILCHKCRGKLDYQRKKKPRITLTNFI